MRWLLPLLLLPGCGLFGSDAPPAPTAEELQKAAAEQAVAEAKARAENLVQTVDTTPSGKMLIGGRVETPNLPEAHPAYQTLPLKSACLAIGDPLASKAQGIQFLGGEGVSEVLLASGQTVHTVPLEYQLTREPGDAAAALLLQGPEQSALASSTDELFITNVVYEKRPGTIPIASVEAECKKRGIR
ncbi:MAG: hypothetical protein AAFR17_12015 [Pseudomonadota bacterium]